MQQASQSEKVVTARERKPLQFFFVRNDLIMRSEDTGGAYSSYEVIAEPERGARSHIHSREDEAIYVIEGQFQVRCGEQEYTLGPGDFISMPKGLPHMFTNVGQTLGRLFCIATPGGLERFFESVDTLLKEKQGKATREELAMLSDALCKKYGIEFLHEE